MARGHGNEMKEVYAWSIPYFTMTSGYYYDADEFRYRDVYWEVLMTPHEIEKAGTGFIEINVHVKPRWDGVPKTDEILFSVTLELQKQGQEAIVIEKIFFYAEEKDTFLTFSLDKLTDTDTGYLITDILNLRVHLGVTFPLNPVGEKIWALRREKTGTDMTITTSTTTLHAHMVMLMGASCVFKAMLTSGMEETASKHIDMKEFSNIALEHFLEYVYTGTCLIDEGEDMEEMDVDNENEDGNEDEDENEDEGGHEDEDEDEDKGGHESSPLVQLWVMGDKYDVPSLVEFIESLQEDHITEFNVIGYFVEADALEAAPIRETCVALISEKATELSGEIKVLPHNVQARLLQQLIEKGMSF